MLTLVATLFVLGVLIFFHELGHFLAAKLRGIRVERFSMGFGPVILRFRKGDTQYVISLIPFGGYVKLAGENVWESKGKKDEFASQPPGIKALIVFAGPLMSFVLAILIFSLLYTAGYPALFPEIGKVLSGYPAEESGLKPGDRIIAINGRKISTWGELAEQVRKNPGKPLKFVVKRKDRFLTLVITPRKEKEKDLLGEEIETGKIGIVASGKIFRKRFPPWKAVYLGVKRVGTISYYFIKALVLMIKGELSLKELGGPVMIARIAGQEARQGLTPLLVFTALVSVNLGIINLFPFPVLDGGYLLLILVEKLRKKPLGEKAQMVMQGIGMAVLLTLMLLVTLNDIQRLWKDKLKEYEKKNSQTLPERFEHRRR